MSVEKFRPSFVDGQIKHESKPYTMVLNNVLNNCDNLEAIGLWCHFQSKPENWIINAQYVRNHFKVGRDKAYELLAYLIETNLMEKKQIINPDGTFGKVSYIIKNGEQFTIKKLSTENTEPLPDLPLPDLPLPENQEHINKRSFNNAYKETNKRKSFYDDQKKNKAVDNSFEEGRRTASQGADAVKSKPDRQMVNEYKSIMEHEERKKKELAMQRFSDGTTFDQNQRHKNHIQIQNIKDILRYGNIRAT
jgi:hypothetical protein